MTKKPGWIVLLVCAGYHDHYTIYTWIVLLVCAGYHDHYTTHIWIVCVQGKQVTPYRPALRLVGSLLFYLNYSLIFPAFAVQDNNLLVIMRHSWGLPLVRKRGTNTASRPPDFIPEASLTSLMQKAYSRITRGYPSYAEDTVFPAEEPAPPVNRQHRDSIFVPCWLQWNAGNRAPFKPTGAVIRLDICTVLTPIIRREPCAFQADWRLHRDWIFVPCWLQSNAGIRAPLKPNGAVRDSVIMNFVRGLQPNAGTVLPLKLYGAPFLDTTYLYRSDSNLTWEPCAFQAEWTLPFRHSLFVPQCFQPNVGTVRLSSRMAPT